MTSTRSAAATGLPNRTTPFYDPSTYPDLYGMAIVGDCMAPELPDGCNAKVSKTEPWGFRSLVMVWFRPEFLQPGALPAMIKRVGMIPPPWVTSYPYDEHPDSEALAVIGLERNDRPGELMMVPCSRILAIHRCLGILKPEETAADLRAPEIVARIKRRRKQLAVVR